MYGMVEVDLVEQYLDKIRPVIARNPHGRTGMTAEDEFILKENMHALYNWRDHISKINANRDENSGIIDAFGKLDRFFEQKFGFLYLDEKLCEMAHAAWPNVKGDPSPWGGLRKTRETMQKRYNEYLRMKTENQKANKDTIYQAIAEAEKRDGKEIDSEDPAGTIIEHCNAYQAQINKIERHWAFLFDRDFFDENTPKPALDYPKCEA